MHHFQHADYNAASGFVDYVVHGLLLPAFTDSWVSWVGNVCQCRCARHRHKQGIDTDMSQQRPRATRNVTMGTTMAMMSEFCPCYDLTPQPISFHFYSASALLAMQSAVLARGILSVCLSVCLSVLPSRSGIVSSRMKIRSCGFQHLVGQSL